MSAWNVITASDLNDYLVAAQASAVRTAALAAGQSDPFANVMHDRCNYIRNRISRSVQISNTAYAVPPELKTCACWLIIEALQTRLPSLRLTDDQKTSIARAYKDLDIAATDAFPVSVPDDPVSPSVNPGTSFEQVSTPTRTATRAKLDGL
jgi:hypothetical protein